MVTIYVCWKADTYMPSTNPKDPYVDFIGSSTYTNDIIPVRSTTTITFQASNNCPYSHVYPFTMLIAPETTGLINVKSNASATVTIDAAYKANVATRLNMVLVKQGDVNGYVINSGKPVIRNEQPVVPPSQIPYLMLGLLALVAAYAAYRWWKNRAIRSGQ